MQQQLGKSENLLHHPHGPVSTIRHIRVLNRVHSFITITTSNPRPAWTGATPTVIDIKGSFSRLHNYFNLKFYAHLRPSSTSVNHYNVRHKLHRILQPSTRGVCVCRGGCRTNNYRSPSDFGVYITRGSSSGYALSACVLYFVRILLNASVYTAKLGEWSNAPWKLQLR